MVYPVPQAVAGIEEDRGRGHHFLCQRINFCEEAFEDIVESFSILIISTCIKKKEMEKE